MNRLVPAVPTRVGILLLFLLPPPAASAQEVGTVTGTVVDRSNDRPIAGVRVLVVDGSAETVTDPRGRFVLTGARAGERLVRAESFGYRASEARVAVSAGQPVALDFALQPEVLDLEGIVVTGTAAGAEARTVAHSVGTIRVEDADAPTPTIARLLQGRLPGVSVMQSSGAAGSGSQIRLRGNVSAALSNEPLVYVDGVRIRSDGYPENLPNNGDLNMSPNDTPSPLDDIDPADIERVEVVKGPAATTLYGAEAASGVIQIFTRRGTTGRPVWTLGVTQGFDRVLDFGAEGDPYVGMGHWLDRTAWRQRYSLGVSGGGAVRYYASTSFARTDGVLPGEGSDRLTLRANLDGEAREDLSLQLSASHTIHDIDGRAAGPGAESLVFNVYRNPSNFVGDTTYATLGRLLDYDLGTGLDHTIAGLTAVHTPTRSWRNRVTVGWDRASAVLSQFMPVGFILAPGGMAAQEDWANTILSAEYVGSLELPSAGDLSATVSWGAQSVTSTVTSDARYAEGFDEGDTPTPDGGELSLASSSEIRVRNSGVFGEALLGYRDRYYLTAGLRLDGSTAFGEDLGLQSYPRVGMSYVVSDEPFWPDDLGRLKLRASYGFAGRAPGVVDALRTWHLTDFVGDTAYVPGALGNPELAPERTVELELGAEAAFFGERLTAEFSWYRQRTTDALFPVSPVPSTGFTQTQLVNVGTLRNDGIELTVGANVLSTSSFAWDARVSIATNHSELTDLGGAPPLRVFDAGYIIEGAPVPTFVAPRLLNPDEVADPVFEEDHVWGPSLPTTMIGVGSTLRFPHDIELEARGEFMGGHVVYDNIGNSQARRAVYAPCNPAYALIAEDREDELTAWQRTWCIRRNVPNDGGPLYPGDFFRIREVSLRAPVPAGLLGDARATMILSATSIWTRKHEDFLQFDPEMVGADGMHTFVRRIDAVLPRPATFTLALKVTR